MAHKKASGGKIKQGNNIVGKRRGLKVAQGQPVTNGTILVRQVGNTFYPGRNVNQGRDFTLYAKSDGVVAFRNLTSNNRGKKAIDIN